MLQCERGASGDVILDGRFLVGIGLLALLILSPGAAWALVGGVAARYGRRAAFVTSLGIASGIVFHSAASALGLSLIIAASPEAFAALRVVGAAYLAYLGVRLLLRGGRGRAVPVAPPSGRDLYLRGLLTNVLNVQIALFYLTFLPQFVSPHEPVVAKSLLFGVAHAVMAIAWFALYAYGISGLASRIRALQSGIERASGIALIGLGVWVVQQLR
jgi:threonine/homoserine/homoserine lactone efflux protein